ncbi:MAG: HEPN domain-containing protein [Bacteroidota bacterium]
MGYNKEDYINYRLKKSDETYNAAKLLAENSSWSSSINRLYYSCFYAVNALLYSSNIKAQTHTGIKNQFSLHFIKTNIIDRKYGKLYSNLFNWRQKGDYSDFFDFDEEIVNDLMNPVQDFIDLINKIIEDNE